MKKVKKILIGMCLLIPHISYSCPALEGKWLSSVDKFQQFNRQWAHIEDKAWAYMMQTQGKEIINYQTDNVMVITSPEMVISMAGQNITQASSEEKIKFDVLGCTPQSIVIKYERYSQVNISHLQFENDNTYWEYMGTANNSGNSHIREYYTKIQ